MRNACVGDSLTSGFQMEHPERDRDENRQLAQRVRRSEFCSRSVMNMIHTIVIALVPATAIAGCRQESTMENTAARKQTREKLNQSASARSPSNCAAMVPA